jgi:diguanylate cyclase (GGDEF)-like protein
VSGTLVHSPVRDSVREGLSSWEATRLPRVLFVDDDPICRRHFEVLLTSRGLTVDVAASADEAIGFARRHQYRVIVCDLMMPRLDGLAVIQRVRPTQSDARYLVTTGAEPSHARGILRGGQLDGVLWKPWEVGSLLAVLERLVLRPERQVSLEPTAPLKLDGSILIVDDNRLDVEKLLADLALGLPKGAVVQVAESLAEAVARVTSEVDRPAVVLMDQELPDAEGLKAVSRLNELGLEAPIIVIGDSADEAVAVQAVQAGAQDYLVRDQADSRRLLRTIRQALGRNDSQAKLTRVALYDQLTGAANRVLFERRTEQAVLAARAQDTKLALLFADVDRFKPINDEFGHDVGDALLSAFAMRLADCLAPTDLLSRLGGDEFAVLSTRIQSRLEAQQLANELRDAMTVPFDLAGHTIPVTASIGLALFPDDASNEKELLRSADVAMYQSKGHRRRTSLRTGENDPNPERRDIARSLRPALEQGQFLLHYQPVVTLTTRIPVAVEAFLRWRRSPSELLFPATFLSVLDTTGMIIPVGRWLLREACRDAARFRALADADLRLSVNCTATQVGDRHFAQDVLSTLEQRSDQSLELELELSESTLASKSEALSESLRELKAVGVSLCMDDFGAGATSLTELRRAGVSSVKIDRSLVSDLLSSEEAHATVAAIITMGKGLRLRVIAEGVEDELTHETLCELGCEYGQGRLYGTPVGSDQLCDILSEQRRVQRG